MSGIGWGTAMITTWLLFSVCTQTSRTIGTILNNQVIVYVLRCCHYRPATLSQSPVCTTCYTASYWPCLAGYRWHWLSSLHRPLLYWLHSRGGAVQVTGPSDWNHHEKPCWVACCCEKETKVETAGDKEVGKGWQYDVFGVAGQETGTDAQHVLQRQRPGDRKAYKEGARKSVQTNDDNRLHTKYGWCGSRRSLHIQLCIQKKSVKWWRKIFFWLVEVVVVNSFILFQQSDTTSDATHLQYRRNLISQLVGDISVTYPGVC